jgi:sec-independent protein translocase protein TatA
MIGNLQGWHLLIILAIVLLLFGAPKLPALARSVGQSMRIFRGEVKEMKNEKKSDDVVADGLSSDADAQDVNVTELKQKS